MDEMDEIVKEFLVESNEGLDQMDHDLVELEKNPTERELLARIFRAIHTVKGTSGVLGFPCLEKISHAGENLLSRMRDGELVLTAQITSGLLAMVDALRAMLREIEQTGHEGSHDYTGVRDALNDLLRNELAAQCPGTQEDGANASPSAPRVGEILVKTAETSPSAVESALRKQAEGDSRKLGQILVESGEVKPKAVLRALEQQVEVQAAPSISGSNIRVDVGLLDKLMNLVGELVLARNQILQYTGSQQDAALLSTAQRLNLITTELQEGVMKTRMQPIGNVWNKFPRVVRDLALSVGKKVRIELKGSETELDKTIIEAIKDPLTHIVRNSVDHGIELASVREAAGKPAEGRLSLRAFHEGGQVNIEITDDGGGIDLDRVRQKALKRGLTSEQLARMSERELTNLIFQPGFSTAEQVTKVSGRGVGMDVVKTNVEKIGGTVDIQSAPGQGTTIKIKIPLTLAIIPALIVTSSGERFAIPQVSLVELVRLELGQGNDGIEYIHGAPVYRLRGHLLPLVHLHSALGLGQARESVTAQNIVVLQADGRQFGLVVDEINDTEEIVVKPLGKQLKGISVFAGATIMGDGEVALILDVLGLAQKTKAASASSERMIAETESGVAADCGERWLVFKAGAHGHMAMPLALVSRLEEFELSAIEKAGQHEVVQYRGHIMPLVHVADSLQMERIPVRADNVQVIVHSANGASVGLVVDEILDVVEQNVTIEKASTRVGLLGSAVIQQHVTDLLDVPTLAASAQMGA